MLFGVGTPNMRAAGMLKGATVAVENKGRLNGATVAIQNVPKRRGVAGVASTFGV